MKISIPREAITEITKEIVEDEKYFDKLFARWYEEQKKTS